VTAPQPADGRAAGSRPATARRRQPAAAVAVAAVVAVVAVAALAGLPGTAMAAVLVVGDSLGVGTEGALRAALPGTQVDADSLNGRPSSAGLPIVADMLGPEHDTVVFDLGTNDGNAAVATTAGSLSAARDLTGDRCLVVATLNRPPLAGVPIDAQNSMIRRFAASTPNVALVDWHDVAQSTPGALRDDGVHATSAGYALRGALFADAIGSGCLGVGGGGGGSRASAPDQAASSTGRPPQRRARRAAPAGPSLEDRAATAIGDRLSADGGPLDIARQGIAVFTAAAAALREVLTPRGPEPVLGAPPER
jgi:lysophospholipase L1-like esterase